MKRNTIRLILSIVICAIFTVACKDDEKVIVNIVPDEGMNLYGVVEDVDGTPLSGIVVSDGYTCTTTNDKGVYQLKKHKFATQVNISLPSEYKVPMKYGIPFFWKYILPDTERYDFVLERMENGAEKDFVLLAIADPQCQDNEHLARFEAETIPDIAETVGKETLPVYGITLGDIGYNTEHTDYNRDNNVLKRMRALMSEKNTKLPIFQVMGNHDYSHASKLTKATYTIEGDIENQRYFETIFGPVNYSFNRGDVHIISMDDIIFAGHNQNDYWLGFRDDQVEWLKQDLSYVSKDKLILFCYHIPIRNSKNQNVQKVLELLKQFPNVELMAGHTHYADNISYGPFYEHIHGAASGAFWHSTVNRDGTPNGYGIYRISGSNITNWHYKATGYSADYQIRLHRGNLEYVEGFSNKYHYYNSAVDMIFANIWNADSEWKVEVYEDGQKTGEMTPQSKIKGVFDAWAAGYHIGVLHRNPDNYLGDGKCGHIYEYQLKNPLAKVKVVAKDKFGNIYEQDKFTMNTIADSPVKPNK